MILWETLGIALLIGLNAFFAAAEIALVSANRVRLRQAADDGNRSARLALRLVEQPSRFLATVQVGITLAGFFASAVGAISLAQALAVVLATLPIPFVAEQASALAVAVVTVIIAFASLVFGELAPKNLAVRRAERVSLAVAYPIVWIGRVAAPIVWLLNSVTELLLGKNRVMRFPSVSLEEILAMTQVAREEGEIDEKERNMVRGALSLRDRHVAELMVPRVDVKALSEDAPLAEARRLITRTGHSRIPVYRGTIDEIVGVVHTKDLLGVLRIGQNDQRPVASIARPAFYIPGTVHADEVLIQMQKNRTHLAIVLDEYGGTAGIVTLENMLEELVGPIRDEYDASEQPEIRLVEDGEVLASGDADLDDVAEQLGVKLSEQEVDTVGGLAYSALDRIPAVGDRIRVESVDLEVLQMTGRRVAQVRLRRVQEPDEGD